MFHTGNNPTGVKDMKVKFRVRLRLFGGALALAFAGGVAQAGTYDLTIEKLGVNITGKARDALTINGQIPGPLLRFKEGEDVTINVTNKLDTDTSLHWHGLLVPYTQDGVPGMSFPGIKPGETFTYRFTTKQSGTYWYHSHSGMQEQEGVYGPLVIDPAGRETFKFDREYIVMLSDWTDEKPMRVMSKLKKQSDYYNYSQRTVGSFFKDAAEKGWGATIRDRLDWGDMRMSPTDISDVTGYTFLLNGKKAEENWTALFKPGERVRLRIINGSAMSYFDLRIPSLKMTVVQADGNAVQPVPVDELRIAVAETYDVIVWPKEEKAYTIFAESLDRTGFARGTLAPRDGMAAEVPGLRPRPLLTMADMGGMHEGMGHGAMAGMESEKSGTAAGGMQGMDHSAMGHGAAPGSQAAAPSTGMQGMDHSAMGHGSMPGMEGLAMKSGIAPAAANGGKVLVYGDLRAMKRYADYRAPDREIEMRLTGNMERYFWSFNDKKYSEAEPIRMRLGERVRIKFVNTTMMSHPMHLHGMWMQLDVGKKEFNPLKHVVNVAPGETLYVDVPVDAPGEWAFHCHLMFHMSAGMFRKVIVEQRTADARIEAVR
jgi:L-ascorbate oxidase